MDDMARQALVAQTTITFWDGQVPKDVLENQLHDIHNQWAKKPWLDWESLPKPFDWMLHQPEGRPCITVAAVFIQRYTARVNESELWDVWYKAALLLREVAYPYQWLVGLAD